MLLFNAPIQDYVAFSMDTVPPLNDLVGGVSLTLDADLTALDPTYKKGSVITLKGKKALKFVRYREQTGGSNLFRMRRHRQYLKSFFESTKGAIQQDPDLPVKAYASVSPYLCTSMSVNNITDLVKQISEYTLNEILAPSGRAVPGEQFYEFHPDEESLWGCVQKAYCQMSED
jgi:anionic cell wall polymer biosynthesis LytR-Cps2A-Psr (LCP) family protein